MPAPINSLLNNKNVGKYLKKGIEYSINFTVDHMFKLEPGFDAVVAIYDENNTIILNPNNRTGEFKGNNVKIKSNNNAMIYIYSRLWKFFNSQIPIENKKGKNIEIITNSYTSYLLDFGFKGFEPIYTLSLANYHGKTIYVENIYDRLETELVEGEKLYLYAFLNVLIYDIKYTENLRNKNNKYNFVVIPKNSTNKTLIINKGNKNKIRYQVSYCQAPHDIKINIEQSNSYDYDLEFNNETTQIDIDLEKLGSMLLRFESENDFVFSYSFIDQVDLLFNETPYWNKIRTIETDFNITIIKKSNTPSNYFTISFNPNYKHSSTKYIIVIASFNEENSLENMSNPCYLSKLATEREKNTIIVDTVDTGENGTITMDIDIFDLIGITDEFIVNIISQELRFDKKINYYIPTVFNQKGIKPINIEIGKIQEFTIDNSLVYYFNYQKQSPDREGLLLYYELEMPTIMTINIEDTKYQIKSFDINETNGYIGISFDEGGLFKISFSPKTMNNNLNNNEQKIRGIFNIFTTETPLIIDIRENNFIFDEINVNTEIDSLKFNISLLSQDYTKKISLENIHFSVIQNFVSIKKNDEEYKKLNFSYYVFEKNTYYQLKIKFNRKDENSYTLEKLNIKDYSLDNIENLSLKEFKYNDINDKFLIINWTNFKDIEINITNNDIKFYKSKINENQIDDIVKAFQNMKFEKLESFLIKKPSNISYEVLMIELKENNSLISFIEKENEEDKDKDKDNDNDNDNDKDNNNNKNNKGNTMIYIIVFSIAIGIIILVAAFLIVRYIKRKKSDIIYVKDMKEEKLMYDL